MREQHRKTYIYREREIGLVHVGDGDYKIALCRNEMTAELSMKIKKTYFEREK